MLEMITGKKVQKYSNEFKVKSVEWSHLVPTRRSREEAIPVASSGGGMLT